MSKQITYWWRKYQVLRNIKSEYLKAMKNPLNDTEKRYNMLVCFDRLMKEIK